MAGEGIEILYLPTRLKMDMSGKKGHDDSFSRQGQGENMRSEAPFSKAV
jgi:hypothetical protein